MALYIVHGFDLTLAPLPAQCENGPALMRLPLSSLSAAVILPFCACYVSPYAPPPANTVPRRSLPTGDQRRNGGRFSFGGTFGLLSTPDWTESGGKNKIERLEFTISPTGVVTERVTGISGPSCQAVTERINEILGEVTSEEATSEMFEVEVSVQNEATIHGGGDASSGTW